MEPPPVALVTGGSSGIGAAICDRFSARGDRVFNADLADRNEPGGATFVECDVTSDAAVEAVVRKLDADVGKLDILVNNAGGAGSPYPIAEMTTQSWNSAFELLLGAPRRMTTAFLPLLERSSSANIVNIASICGLQPGWGGAAYSVAKAALIKLTEEAAAEFARRGIQVNAVSPGFIPTPIFGRTRGLTPDRGEVLRQAIESRAHDAQPLPRPGSADAIAAAVAYLTSPDAAFVTGTNLVVDGGLSLAPAHMWDASSTSPVARILAEARSSLEVDEGGAG
ncbi:MAG: SDR family oxidoreductase [Henriciella sp.]|uniref:SDR family NAD(P)-dependent oxidoreductase n=1 Tax=Henriciella sp. TaxID=1968823 RepID=UPI003C75706E